MIAQLLSFLIQGLMSLVLGMFGLSWETAKPPAGHETRMQAISLITPVTAQETGTPFSLQNGAQTSDCRVQTVKTPYLLEGRTQQIKYGRLTS